MSREKEVKSREKKKKERKKERMKERNKKCSSKLMSHNVKANSKKVNGIQIRTREVSVFYDTPHPSPFVAITPLP